MDNSYGEKLKADIQVPGGWSINIQGFGEILPYHENKMYLDYNKKDKWGLPTVTFDAEIKENEKIMRKDIVEQASEMLDFAWHHYSEILEKGWLDHDASGTIDSL